MSGAWTPGPWLAKPAFNADDTFRVFWQERGQGWVRDRRIDRDTAGGFSPANARLIAAAPRLYARLTEAREAIASLDVGALGYVDLPDGWTGEAMPYSIRDELLCNLDGALAEARGETL